MNTFTKSPLSHPEQVALLKTRGMLFEEGSQAEFSLKHVNYYRLSAYWKIFEIKDAFGKTCFQEKTSFKTIINLYNFDKKLRLFLTPLIETFEVSLRSNWAYEISVGLKNSHSYLEFSLYEEKNIKKIQENIAQIKQKFVGSEEDFSRHYRNKYKTPELPPTWTICEIFTFGNLMYFYSYLNGEYRRKISSNYELDESIFLSFLKNFLRVRNICAHHGRLWNTKLNTCSIRYPKSKVNNNSILVDSINTKNNENIYNTVVFLIHIQNLIEKETSWKKEFIDFIDSAIKNGVITTDQLEKLMGFPENWKLLPI
ncbi:MAG: Abi family protein, partial [Bdellovibrionota bacterium]